MLLNTIFYARRYMRLHRKKSSLKISTFIHTFIHLGGRQRTKHKRQNRFMFPKSQVRGSHTVNDVTLLRHA